MNGKRSREHYVREFIVAETFEITKIEEDESNSFSMNYCSWDHMVTHISKK
jgi:hypothetical protein